MNKTIVDSEIKSAYEAIKECKISEDGKSVEKTFRGQISSFGAAVTMGSLTSAIAFFADNGGASVERSKLLDAIVYVLKDARNKKLENAKELFDYANTNKREAKEEILNAALAIKLALNLYTLEKK